MPLIMSDADMVVLIFGKLYCWRCSINNFVASDTSFKLIAVKLSNPCSPFFPTALTMLGVVNGVPFA